MIYDNWPAAPADKGFAHFGVAGFSCFGHTFKTWVSSPLHSYSWLDKHVTSLSCRQASLLIFKLQKMWLPPLRKHQVSSKLLCVQTIWHKNIVCGCRVVLIQECSRGNESHHHLNNCHIHISVRLRDPALCLYFLILRRSGHFWASDIGQWVSSNQQIIAHRLWGQDSC